MHHKYTWLAIDKIAANKNMTCAALASYVGLDATLFNKSKRYTRDGKPHMPSFNTILKLIDGLDMTLSDFEALMIQAKTETAAQQPSPTDSQ